jgi:ankyrin repeat protein
MNGFCFDSDRERLAPIHIAIVDDDMRALQSLLDAGGDASESVVLSGLRTVVPLSLAIVLGRDAAVPPLLAARADIWATVTAFSDRQLNVVVPPRFERSDVCVLQFAALCASETVLTAMLASNDNSSDMLISDVTGDTLCHFAAWNANDGAMAALLATGANSRRRNLAKEMPCHIAARNDNSSALAALIAAGADCGAPDGDGRTACHIVAARRDESLLAQLIASGVACDVPDKSGASPCHVAAHNSNDKLLGRLIAAGCDVNRRNAIDVTPAHIAARHPIEAMMARLIAAHADVNAVDRYGETPLSLACANVNEKLFAMLIDAGAELSACSLRERRTLCHVAAANENALILKQLIALDVDVNARDEFGATPCHYAAQFGAAAGLRALVAAGAIVDAVDLSNRNVCHYAAMNERHDVLQLVLSLSVAFEERDNVGRTALHEAVRCRRERNVQLLLDAGADVNAADVRGMSLLHHAARDRDELSRSIVWRLLQRGASCHARDAHGRTPMFFASTTAMTELFARGAKVDAHDRLRLRPYDLLIDNHHGDLLVVLIAAGADIAACDKYGWMVEYDPDGTVFYRGDGSDDDGDAEREQRMLAEAGAAMLVIALCQWRLLRLRGHQVCVGLQSLKLPALVTCEILAHAFAPIASMVPLHRVWALVTKVKHFDDL